MRALLRRSALTASPSAGQAEGHLLAFADLRMNTLTRETGPRRDTVLLQALLEGIVRAAPARDAVPLLEDSGHITLRGRQRWVSG
jgi:hypothetical protein